MEYGSIEREIHVDAAPQIVYEVISTPEHLSQWWPDQAELEAAPGAVGRLTFGDGPTREAHVTTITVVEADPPRQFSFRWMSGEGTSATSTNALLVTFDVIPLGAGTLLRFSETGFREKGWEAAVLEQQYREHVTGWDYFLPRLVTYATRLVSKP